MDDQDDQMEFRINAEMMKIMLHLMRAKEAEVIVDALSELMIPINEHVRQAKKNYDQLTKQIKEIESSDDTTFN